MNDYKNKEYFLANWISGNLTDSDLKTFITSEDYESLLIIRETLNNMVSPNPISLDIKYQELKSKIDHSKRQVEKKEIKLIPFISIAASILILFGLGLYHIGLLGSKEYGTTTAIKKINFGKNVSVTLSQNTILSQNAPLYNLSTIYLKKGKAYFEVVKGNNFLIKTSQGIVEVLGTKFAVQINNEILEVKCFEGKVKVTSNDSIYYVTKGMQYRSDEKEIKNIEIENTKLELKYKKFSKTSLANVIAFIEQNYKTNIDCPKSFINYKFTGTIPLDNLEESLSLVCYSFNLKFEVNDKNVIIKK